MLKQFISFILILQLAISVYPLEQNFPSHVVQKFLTASEHTYPLLRGILFDPEDATRMEFIVDSASEFTVNNQDVNKLTAYFLAGLTVPEKDFWVNLSPYEKDRVIPASLEDTGLGHTMLKTDYVLKEMAAAFLYPGTDSGKNYWQSIYAQAGKDLKVRNIPINAFNKIWIVPKIAKVYENDGVVYILKAEMEALTENDYLAMQKNNVGVDLCVDPKQSNTINGRTQENIRKYIIPQINRAVNESEEFAPLRQIYYALILSTWFKNKLKDSCYGNYIDKDKTTGLILADKSFKQKIYNQYTDLFKNGLYNYIQNDKHDGKIIKRRYVCGGLGMNQISVTTDIVHIASPEETKPMGTSHLIPVTALTRRLGASPLGESLINPKDLDTADTLVKVVNTVVGYTGSAQGIRMTKTCNRLLTTIMDIFDDYVPDLNEDGLAVRDKARTLFNEARKSGFTWDNSNLVCLQEIAKLTPTIADPNEQLVIDSLEGFSDAQLKILMQNGAGGTFQLLLTRNCPNQCSHCGFSAGKGPIRHIRFAVAVKAIKRFSRIMGAKRDKSFLFYHDSEPLAWRDSAINATVADIYAQAKAAGCTYMPVFTHGMDRARARENRQIMAKLLAYGKEGIRVSLHLVHKDAISLARAKVGKKISATEYTLQERRLVNNYADRFFSMIAPLAANHKPLRGIFKNEIFIERFSSFQHEQWSGEPGYSDKDEFLGLADADKIISLVAGHQNNSMLAKVWSRIRKKVKTVYKVDLPTWKEIDSDRAHKRVTDNLCTEVNAISWTGNGAQTLHELGASDQVIRSVQDYEMRDKGVGILTEEKYNLSLLGDGSLRLECVEGYKRRFRTPQEMHNAGQDNFDNFLGVLRKLASGKLGKDFAYEKKYFDDVVRAFYFTGEDLDALLKGAEPRNIAHLYERMKNIPFSHRLWEMVVGKEDTRLQRDIYHAMRNYELPQTVYQRRRAQNIEREAARQQIASAQSPAGVASATDIGVAKGQPLGGVDITADRLKVTTSGNIFKLKNFHTSFLENFSGLTIQPESSWDLFDYELQDMLVKP